MAEYDEETHKTRTTLFCGLIQKATQIAVKDIKEGAYIDFLMQVQGIGDDFDAANRHCNSIKILQEKMNCHNRLSSAYSESMDTLEDVLKKKCD